MGPIDATMRCLARPLSWSGRASPSEYWWFTAVHYLVLTAVWLLLMWPAFEMIVADVQGRARPTDWNALEETRVRFYAWVMVIGIYPYFCNISVAVRRLHDTDRSGWWWWIQLVPLVGWLILLVLLILPGDTGRNDHGKSPHGPAPGEVGRPGAGMARDLPPLDPTLRAPVAMGPLQAVVACLLTPFTWRGRAGPAEYWWFTLVAVCASGFAAMVLSWPVFQTIDTWEAAMLAEQQRAYDTITPVRPVPFPDLRPAFMESATGWLVYVALSIPVGLSSLAVMVRRLHDTDHSGWWTWIVLVPLVGPVFLIILLAAPGQIHRNRYGPGRGVQVDAPVRGSDMPVVPRDPLAGVASPESLRALRQSRMGN